MSAKPAILVCGGAGYIGSHMCKRLARAGYTPVTFDNLSTGHRRAVRWGPLIEGDLLDAAALGKAFRDYPLQGVMHFAARSIVSESVSDPGLYFRNNIAGTLNLLDAMRTSGVDRLVFSSTAAVYGNPVEVPITEGHPTQPINPYGQSKLYAEGVIGSYCSAHGLRAIALRYFNAAGADPDGEIGESHEPETHLIPNALRAAASGSAVKVFGDDYPTPDGTCVRDYVHVDDLCDAHLLALDRLAARPGFEVFNLGGGTGRSVLEVLSTCREATGLPLQQDRVARRSGDPAVLVASSAAAREQLGWSPRHDLRDCITHALKWTQSSKSDAADIAAQGGSLAEKVRDRGTHPLVSRS